MKKNIFSTLLFFNSFVIFGQSTGNSIYDDSFIHEVKLTFAQVNHIDSLNYYYDQYLNFNAPKQYMLANAEIDGVLIDSIGVREKGFYSNWGSTTSKKPLKINFKTYTGERFDGLNKMNFQNGFMDPSIMRDALAYKFMRDNGINAPRTAHCKLYINNVYWGVYIMVEQIDSRFLKHGFDDNDGNLFKCIDNSVLKYYGTNVADYESEFELKTKKVANDWSGFLDLVDRINNTSQFGDTIESIFDIINI
jgi:spore coat protein CotH